MSDVLDNRFILCTIAENVSDIASLCKLATVSKLFYEVFTSDKVWRKFDAYNCKQGIFKHFLSISTDDDLEFFRTILIYEGSFHWYRRYQENKYAILDVYANNRDHPPIQDLEILKRVLELTCLPILGVVSDELLLVDRDLSLEYFSRGISLANCPAKFRSDKEFMLQVIERYFLITEEVCDCDEIEVIDMPLQYSPYPLVFDHDLLSATMKTGSYPSYLVNIASDCSLKEHIDELVVSPQQIRTCVYYHPRQHLCAVNSNPVDFFMDPKADIQFKEESDEALIFQTPNKGPEKDQYTFAIPKLIPSYGSYVTTHMLQLTQLTDLGWAIWNNPNLISHCNWISDDKNLGHLALVALQRGQESHVKLIPPHLFEDYDFAMMAVWYNKYVIEQIEFQDTQLLEIVARYKQNDLGGIREIISQYIMETSDRLTQIEDDDGANTCKYWKPLSSFPRYHLRAHCSDMVYESWLGDFPEEPEFDFNSDSDGSESDCSLY